MSSRKARETARKHEGECIHTTPCAIASTRGGQNCPVCQAVDELAALIDAEVAALVHAARAMGDVKSTDTEAPRKFRRVCDALDGWSVEPDESGTVGS